jgi:mannonate dehydratase
MSEVIDMHIHVFGDGGGNGSCYMSPMLRAQCVLGEALGFLEDTPLSLDDDKVRDAIHQELHTANLVDKGVLLAFDRPYDNKGDPMKPQLYTPNSWVAGICKDDDKALFGASVHPYREDWSEKLEECKQNHAVLVKWIPSSQNILPSDPRCIPYYEKLKQLELPLLCHVGDEHTIMEAGGDKSLRAYNHPSLLRPALDLGVTVIMAHCCLPLMKSDNDFSETFVRMLEQADKNGWNLYADVSALVSLFFRRSLRAKIMALRLPHERLLLGSDYPVPVKLDKGFRTEANRDEFERIKRIDNSLDRNYEFLKLLGFSDTVMTNAVKILKQN